MTRIAGMDGVRGLSVIAVVMTHLGVYEYLIRVGLLSVNVSPLINGSTGVQIFFVLSGFLITALLIKERDEYGSISIRDFFIRRALRIIPLYFLVLLLSLFVSLTIWPVIGKPSLIFAATFLTNFIPKIWYATILGHTWSLAVEEHFYLFWPLTIVFIYRFGWQKILLHLAIGLLVASVLYATVIRCDFLTARFFVERWSFFAGIYIAMGCGAAILVFATPFRDLKAALTSPWAAAAAAILYFGSIGLGDALRPLSELTRGIGVAFFVAWLANNQNNFLVAVLEFKPLAYVGKISYGVYMWQGFFLATGPRRIAGQLWPLAPSLGLFFLIIVAPLSYHYFENNFLSLKRRFRNRASRTMEPTPHRQDASLAPQER